MLTCVDLFAGAGGLSEGFKVAGFSILAANDFDEFCAKTYKFNHPDTIFLEGPIQQLNPNNILDIIGLQPGELDCLIGGPPCQAFSVYNHQRGMHDERSGLFREYLRIVEGLMPKFIVMENVPGMTSIENGRAIKEIESGLQQLGYHVEHRILKAEEYGVPQERRRIIFMGTRLSQTIIWPNQTHGSMVPFVNVWDAIGDLPVLDNGEGEEEQKYPGLPSNDYQLWIRQGSNKIYNHVAPILSPINLKRLKYIPQGGSWRDIPVELLPSGMKRARRSDHTKRYGRLHPKGLACTILTKCDPHWGAFFHPTQDRALSVREAARLQSIPDTIKFLGPKAEQYRQVGNAVPTLLAHAIARSVKKSLDQLQEDLQIAL
jgi:DNA (cytosine-5)-methyltransferase 1